MSEIENPPIYKVALEYTQSEGMRDNLAVIFGLFQRGDHVYFAVLCPAADAETDAQIHKEISNIPCNFPNKIDFHVIVDATEVDSMRSQADIVLSDTPIDDEVLFEAYRAHVTPRYLSAYEGELVIDLYDPVKIGEQRREEETKNYFGSTNLNKFLDYIQFLEQRLGEDEGEIRVLDMGCGAGALYFALKKYFSSEEYKRISYLGVDFSRGQILRARSLFPEAEFCYGSADVFDLGEQTFDLIVLNSVLPFISPEKQIEIVEKMIKRSGGNLFAGLISQSTKIGFPNPSKWVSQCISMFTETPQLEFSIQGGVLERLVSRLGSVDLHQEHLFKLIRANKAPITFGTPNHEYSYIYKLMESALHLPRHPSGGLQVTSKSHGEGIFFEITIASIRPKGFVSRPNISRIGENLNILFD